MDHKTGLMFYGDFPALIEAVKVMSDAEKEGLSVYEDEGIIRVLDAEDQMIFSAYTVNFVHAFFGLLGIDIDSNIDVKKER